MQKTVEVPQVQYIDRTVDVPVVMQGQVLVSQTVQKTAEAPQVQFLDRVPDVPVATQLVEVPKIVSQDKIPQRTAEQVMDIPVLRLSRKSSRFSRCSTAMETVSSVRSSCAT